VFAKVRGRLNFYRPEYLKPDLEASCKEEAFLRFSTDDLATQASQGWADESSCMLNGWSIFEFYIMRGNVARS
jgi:hypothetical protein